MLDIRKIRENPDFYRERLARRNSGDEKLIAHVLVLDEEIRKLKQEGEALKSHKNRAAKMIGEVFAKGFGEMPSFVNEFPPLIREAFIKGFIERGIDKLKEASKGFNTAT